MKVFKFLAIAVLLASPLAHAQEAAPAAAPVTCAVGGQLDVLWNGSWYPATVEAGPNESGQCQIGYDGYGDEWDEWVGADRMRPRSVQ